MAVLLPPTFHNKQLDSYGKSSNNHLQGDRFSQGCERPLEDPAGYECDFYGIDYEAKQISVRGHIYWAEYEEDDENALLSFETESAWDACTELFEEINHHLHDELSISYRVCECGCEVYYVHDEGSFFPEECCVSSNGKPFEDAYDDVYDTVKDAINEWVSKTGIEQGERTEEQMVDFINEYEYENEETYFYIRVFTFE